MSKIEQSILDSIEILLDKRVSQLQFDRTVRATIIEKQDQSIGRYKVRYQNSEFSAYAIDSDATYRDNDQVYVEIPSSDYNKTKMIIGSVKELGSRYIDAVTSQGKMTTIGSNVFSSTDTIAFCSYNGKQEKSLQNIIAVDPVALSTYKNGRKYILIGMNVKTALPTEQQVAGGNYGIIVQAKYYNTAYKNQQIQEESDLITRTYVLDVNNMLGQPYKYTLKNRQYAIFPIDGDNLKEISSITAFCKDFPVTKSGQPQDIFLSDFELEFMEPLTTEELNGTSLKILTPRGAYITSNNDDTKYLQAEMKIKGRKVNLDNQTVDFYWFIKDTTITSNSAKYSAYAGEGWRELNQNDVVDHTGKRQILPLMIPSAVTTFKCVAVYKDEILFSTIDIENRVSTTSISISSSAGTQFYFDTGKTTLTCNVKTTTSGLSYHWGYRDGDGALIFVPSASRAIDVTIAEATSVVTYECTVLTDGQYLGTATITLTNGAPQNQYNLVINNGTQIFKYNEYGVSPASLSSDKKINILPLTFDIYNDQGQLALSSNIANDALINKTCEVKWIWPDNDDYTLLTLNTDTYPLKNEQIVDPSGNGNVVRRVISNAPSLSFGIANRYDPEALDNTIKLQVNFQGHSLVALTNFTFTKEGELGTNGTEYVSRLVPFNSQYQQVYLENGHVEAWGSTVTKRYDKTSSSYKYFESFSFTQPSTNYPLRAQIWTGSDNALYDSQSNTSIGNINWSLVDVGRNTKHNAEINNTNGQITPTGYNNVSTVVETTISSNKLSQDVRNYYATYPLTVAKTPSDSYHAIIDGGYTQCMYNSDGTRSSFNTKPFKLRIFNGTQEEVVAANRITWAPSWYNASEQATLNGKNSVDIEPPARYNSESTNNYIRVTYDNYLLIISVHFYLNRYGLAAMNDWDGTSIKLNQKGDSYILAPQMGAGEKSHKDGSFTGITMGKSFGVDGNQKSADIGLMGFGSGVRTLFLNAKTGSATFGASGDGQIVIQPGANGRTKATIKSGNYNTSNKTGMMIDLETPQILFGSSNFMVNEAGYLTAKGGGSIAGWSITDTKLISSDKKTALYSGGGDNDERISVGNSKFVVYGDGRFKAANDKFSVDATGKMISTEGSIGGWNISSDRLSSPDGSTILYSARDTSANGQRINVNNRFIVNRDGSFSASNGNFSVNSTGKMTASEGTIGGWNINRNSLYSNNITLNSNGSLSGGAGNSRWSIGNNGVGTFTNIVITGGNAAGSSGSSSINFGTNFGVDPSGNMWAKQGSIGSWTLDMTGLRNAASNILINPSKLQYGSGFSVDSAGNANISAGTIGGCSIKSGHLQVPAANISGLALENLQYKGAAANWEPLSLAKGWQLFLKRRGSASDPATDEYVSSITIKDGKVTHVNIRHILQDFEVVSKGSYTMQVLNAVEEDN